VSSPEASLRRCWHALAGDCHESTIDAVLARHREPHRRYHTAVHVMWVLRHIDHLLADDPQAAAVDAEVVRSAALFHDVVYDPRSSTNEHASAVFAVAALGPLEWAPQRIGRVAELIEATAGHDADGPDGAVLLDADLGILGASPAEYQAYVTGVRSEYSHVSQDAWRQGRAAVLRSFLDRPAIYATATMRDARERRARANITAELSGLGGPSATSSPPG
jgi:predicted metal-dependent HD superfamily phosphohydrolase